MAEWRRPADLTQGASKVIRSVVRKNRPRFIDRVRILAAGGDGGHGASSRFRDNRVANGGPDGGNGGRGGDVYLRADHNVSDLRMSRKSFKAESGGNGGADDMIGCNGKRLDIKVPLGTTVYRLGEPSLSRISYTEPIDAPQTLLAELLNDGDELLVARGGQKGRGNADFYNGIQQHALVAEDGGAGEAVTLMLSLKLIADVGLVGFPNAGKSSLLRVLSNATPEVASYPFTTLHPYLGRVKATKENEFTVADIPGIIEGAHENRGLGHGFLRHIERTSLLCYVVDLAAASDSGITSRSHLFAPFEQFDALRRELNLYQPGLADRPCIVVANKADVDGAPEALHVLRGEIARLHAIGELPGLLVDADGSGGSAVTAISALHSKNIARLVRRLAASLRVAKRALAADEAAEAKKERDRWNKRVAEDENERQRKVDNPYVDQSRADDELFPRF